MIHPSELAQLERDSHSGRDRRMIPEHVDATDNIGLAELVAPTVAPGSIEEELALSRIMELREDEQARVDDSFAARSRRWQHQQRRAINHDPRRYRP